MTIRGVWPVNGGDRIESVRGFLSGLVEKNIVSALLLPIEGKSHSVMPALVKDPDRLVQANPFAPVMAFNSARLVSALTREPTGETIGAVLRSCEIRALIELVKFNQARLDHVLIIGLDCLGTLTVPDYAAALQQFPDLTNELFEAAAAGDGDRIPFRLACRICEQPAPSSADISIGFIGTDGDKGLLLEMRDDLAERMNLSADEKYVRQRQDALTRLSAKRATARDAALQEFHLQMRRDGGMASYLASCLECTNCMNACPICYCKQCFFRTANAERAPRDLFRASERQGALAMPPDGILFQLTRLNHMATSCVGCGMCEAACPHHIPLTAMFRAVGMRVQREFNYVPGVDVNDKPPFMEFRQNELLEMGEAH